MDQLLLPLLLVGLLLLMFNSTRKRRREAAATQTSLVPGAQVITTAGLYATVVAVEDTAIVLEVGDGGRSRWARGAIARIVETPAASSEVTDPAATSSVEALDGDAGTAPGTATGRVDLGKPEGRDTAH